MKKFEHYRIICNSMDSEGRLTEEHLKICFPTKGEAQAYCEYLKIHFSNASKQFTYKKETTLLFNKAYELIKDPDEEKIRNL